LSLRPSLQRLRVTFARGEKLKYLSHLDLMRLWGRALRRAGIPLVYSSGFSPHPKLSLAAPLPIGVTSEAELMDLFLSRRLSPYLFMKAVSPQLPQGIEVLATQEVGLRLPSAQSQVRFAEYRVEVETEMSPDEVRARLASLLALRQLPWQHMRDTGPRKYDLRALIDDLWLAPGKPRPVTLGMRLRTDDRASGRPDQVAIALGFPDPLSIHRTKLILANRA